MMLTGMLSPRAVLFDLGSTLIEYPSDNWDEVVSRCLEAARGLLVSEGHSVPDADRFYAAFHSIREEYRRRAAETLDEWTIPEVTERLFLALGIAMHDGLVDRFFDAFYGPLGEIIYPFPDAAPVLQRLAQRYQTVGLISNTVFPDRAHLDELRRFGLLHHLDFQIFSSSFGVRKPHPAIFCAAANKAGLAPSECVYIGDRYVEDITGPEGIGMPAILRVHPHREYPAEMPPTVRTIRSLSELEQHLPV